MIRCPNCGDPAENYPTGVRQTLEPGDSPGGVPVALDGWWCWVCLKEKVKEARAF